VCCSVLQCSYHAAHSLSNIQEAVRCIVLRCVAVCCSVLQRARSVVQRCIILRFSLCNVYTLERGILPAFRKLCVAECCSVLQCVAVCYSSMLPIVAESCSVHTTKCWILPIFISAVLQCVAASCSKLQCAYHGARNTANIQEWQLLLNFNFLAWHNDKLSLQHS